jgi:hypothetical protein
MATAFNKTKWRKAAMIRPHMRYVAINAGEQEGPN